MNKLFVFSFGALIAVTGIYIYYINETMIELTAANDAKDAELDNLSQAYLAQIKEVHAIKIKEEEERKQFLQVMGDVLDN